MLSSVAPNPTQRTVFIDTFPFWHGELRELESVLQLPEDFAFRSGLCCSLAEIPRENLTALDQELLRPLLQNIFDEAFVEAPSIGIARFPYTTFVPATFARAEGWTNFQTETKIVTILLVAMADPQPKVLNFISVIISSFTLIYISIKSPQTGLPTFPYPSGFSITPTFFGFMKCSITFSLYPGIFITSYFASGESCLNL